MSSRVDALQLTLRAIVSYAFAAPDFRAQGGQLHEREPVLREGRSYRRLAVAPFRGALLDAIVDPVTGLVAGVVSDERHYAFELRDERRIGGKLVLPYTIALLPMHGSKDLATGTLAKILKQIDGTWRR